MALLAKSWRKAALYTLIKILGYLVGGADQTVVNPFGDTDAKQKLLKNPVTAAYMQEEDFRNIID